MLVDEDKRRSLIIAFVHSPSVICSCVSRDSLQTTYTRGSGDSLRTLNKLMMQSAVVGESRNLPLGKERLSLLRLEMTIDVEAKNTPAFSYL